MLTDSKTQWLNKVPEVTLFFWLIKMLSTIVGETAADFLNMDLGLPGMPCPTDCTAWTTARTII